MKISCIIPVYNAGPYLEAALDSVLSQDWPLHEVIAVDDGSTDASPEILRRHEQAITIVTVSHRGIPAARNAGLRRVSGDVIAFLDADDLWPARRLRAMAEELDREPSVDVLAGLVQIQDERPVRPPVREDLATKHRFLLGSLLIRRGVFDRVGLFNEALDVGEDTEFVMRARRQGVSFKSVDHIALIYRLHANNISRDVGRNQSMTLDALRVITQMKRRS